MKRREISIKWKIFLYLLVFAALTLAVIWIFQVFLTDRIYKEVRVGEIKETAASLCSQLGSENFSGTTERTAKEKQLCISVLRISDTQMYQIASADTLPNCAIHRISMISKMKLYFRAKENGGEDLQHLTYDKKTGSYYSTEGELFDGDERVRGDESIIYTFVKPTEDGDTVIMINAVITPVNSAVKAVNIQMMFVSAILLIISLVMALFISNGISSPIIKLNESAKQLANGKYENSFKAGGYREISELGNTLDMAEKELAATDGMRRELIANISHDLRTPLTMIGGFAEMMRDIPDENNPENAQVIIDETQRLSTLVNDCLDVSKLEAGADAVNPTEFCITESVRAMLSRYNTLIKAERYDIVFEYEEKADVYQDESKLLKVIYNLVNNAVTYTGADRRVHVAQISSGERLRFEVHDSGTGIDPEKLPFIWDRYYKVDKEHKRNSVGSGLGLSIVRTVMDMLGGSYGVVTSPNGSTFWIEFDRRYVNRSAE